YSYYIRDSVDAVSDRNAYLVGDAVGLATRDMCEGIGPAVRSSLLAAQSIVTGEPYSLAGISELSGDSFVSRLLERQFAGHQAGRML
ncbi:MAG: NAD(P)/FAD-dependent oxidoreductase, partial [Gammaproteobacteria bacterium]|nr:NAD(P)/FAD-dependent oxidoreductase [Gammaproteobacteria bacterium]